MYYGYVPNNWPAVPYPLKREGVGSYLSDRPGIIEDDSFQVLLKLNILILQLSTSAGTCNFRIHVTEHLIITDSLEYLIVTSFTP